jgi:hypothetical protein
VFHVDAVGEEPEFAMAEVQIGDMCAGNEFHDGTIDELFVFSLLQKAGYDHRYKAVRPVETLHLRGLSHLAV